MSASIIAAVRKRVGGLTQASKLAIFVELILATGVCFARMFPFSVQIFLLGFASISLWLRGSTWGAVGLRNPKNWFAVFLLALVFAIAISVIVNLLVGPFVEHLSGKAPDTSRFGNIRGNLPVLVGWLIVAWTMAGFAEEMFFRGYLMNRISDLVGSGRAGWTSALLVSSLLFGLAHGYQGLAGAIGAAEIGLLLGVMYLWNKRNLWMNIACHGFIDSISLVSLYLSNAS